MGGWVLLRTTGGSNLGRKHRLRHEEVVIIKVAVHTASDLSRFGAKGWASALKKDNYNYAAVIRISIAREPAKAGSGVRAGASLA